MEIFDRVIDLALEEDLGAAGDVTTAALVDPEVLGTAELWAKEAMVLAGTGAFARVFARVDPRVAVSFGKVDGESVGPKERVGELSGPLRALLTGERTALNFIQRSCGMATLAREAVEAVRGTELKVLDTRKTSPGLRHLAREAVRAGGAHNHRFGLFDGVLIKDNHIAAVGGSVSEALRRARERAPRLVKIEVEITRLAQLEEAIAGGADVVMLDNMTDEQIGEAVRRAKGRVELEASGGISVERLPKLAKLGVNYASMGALTHSARAMDLSLEILGSAAPARPARGSSGRRR